MNLLEILSYTRGWTRKRTHNYSIEMDNAKNQGLDLELCMCASYFRLLIYWPRRQSRSLRSVVCLFFTGTCDAAYSRMARWHRVGNSRESAPVLVLSRLADYFVTVQCASRLVVCVQPLFCYILLLFLSVSASYIFKYLLRLVLLMLLFFVKYIIKIQ